MDFKSLESFGKLSKKGGELEFILPDDTNPEHLKIIASRFNQNESHIKSKINQCRTKLDGIFIKANRKGKITIIKSTKFH